MQLPLSVAHTLTRLHQAGYQAYPVGGCVRDSLLGLCPHDWDLTTDATPAQLQALFSCETDHVIPTGLPHGTLTLIVDGTPLEITTFRCDGDYEDNRHPRQVTFTRSLTDDLARRDFTINAMAWDLQTGLIDPFGGQQDLNQRLLRCVGNPEKRFQEDALRLLRGLRFASERTLTIEPKTAQAVNAAAPLLAKISAERITQEFTRLLCGENAAFVLLSYPAVISFLFPEMRPLMDLEPHNPHHIYTVYEHTVRAVAAASPRPTIRWALWLHDCGKADCFTLDDDNVGHFYGHASLGAQKAEAILSRFRLNRHENETILELVRRHDLPLPPDEILLTKRLSRFGRSFLLDLLDVQEADCAALAPSDAEERSRQHQEARRIIDLLCERQACFSLHDLTVNGRDLLALGYMPGQALGQELQSLLAAVMEQRLPNKREALLNAARQHLV